MKRFSLSVAAVAALGLSVAPAGAARPPRDLVATLSAAKEVPVVSSAAKGSFRAEIADDGLSFEYFLDYEGLEGLVTQSHIHIGQRFAAGGISVWLCKTGLVTVPPTVPADTPVCGAPGGEGPEATGVISAEDVIGPTGQAVPVMQFAELMALIRAGNAYVNVHSQSAPGGEVRGQIKSARGASDPGRHDDDHRHDH
jgi:hypothetical protein